MLKVDGTIDANREPLFLNIFSVEETDLNSNIKQCELTSLKSTRTEHNFAADYLSSNSQRDYH